MKNIFATFILVGLLLSCKLSNTEVAPQLSLETVAPAASTGLSISKTIGTAGGSLDIPSAKAKITVPAGAMAVGAILSVAPTKDALDNEGEGMQISGAWTKPISVQYTLTTNEDIANYRLYAKIPNGLWVGSRKTNVIGNTVTVKLGPNSGSGIKNGRIMAKLYDLAFAKNFYLKPDGANLDLGQTETFKAYTREGKVPYKWKGDDGKWHYVIDDDEPLSPLAPQVKSIDDDEIVPLAPTKKYVDDDDIVPLARNNDIGDGDVLAPLVIGAKEYQFSNSKAGFTRNWTAGTDVGKIDQNGKFTAVTDPAAKGKSTRVTFTSINSKTNQTVVASATVSIKDGVARYAGTFNFESTYIENNPSPAYPTNTTTVVEKEAGKITLKAIPNEPDRYIIDLSQENEAELYDYSLKSERVASTGRSETKSYSIIVPTQANWAKYDEKNTANPLIFNKDNTYSMRIKIPTEKGKFTTFIKYENGSTDTGTSDLSHNTKFTTMQTAGNDNIKNTDPNLLKGEKSWKSEIRETSSGKVTATVTYTAKWEFKKVQ